MKKLLSVFLCAILVFVFSLTAFAAPSVEQKGTPKVVTPTQNNTGTKKNNNNYYKSNTQTPVEDEDELEMVAAFDIPEDSTDPEDIEFREAYEKLQKMDLGSFVVRDVFDVRGELKKGVNDTITFDVSTYGDKIAVYEYLNGEWSQVPTERTTRYSDGTMSVTLIDTCPLAIAVDPTEDKPVTPAPVVEEECCDHWYCNDFCCNLMGCEPGHCSCWILYTGAVVVLAGLIALVAIIAVKKKK